MELAPETSSGGGGGGGRVGRFGLVLRRGAGRAAALPQHFLRYRGFIRLRLGISFRFVTGAAGAPFEGVLATYRSNVPNFSGRRRRRRRVFLRIRVSNICFLQIV